MKKILLLFDSIVLLAGITLIIVSQTLASPEYSNYTQNNRNFNRELKTSRIFLGIGVFLSISGGLSIGKNFFKK